MRAVLYSEYGPPEVLHLGEVEVPRPKPTELLVRVHATSVTTGDVNARGFVFVPKGLKGVARLMFGLRRPSKAVLGTDFAGVVEAVGESVTRFAVGDRVFGTTEGALGAYAEYLTIGEGGIVCRTPATLSDEEAAAVPFGALSALLFVREKVQIAAGERVMVIGAAGGVGIWALQLAHAAGAEVTAVCSTGKVALVQSMGADHVIDYTSQELSSRGIQYDLIIDTVGALSLKQASALLSEKGRLLAVAGGIKELVQAPLSAMGKGPKLIAGPATPSQKHLVEVAALLEAGTLRPVIDRRFALEEIVEAHRYVDQGHKQGSVIITLNHAV
jgi:NADPH:quinone reductase-like Zn-dependent oxidoreductase